MITEKIQKKYTAAFEAQQKPKVEFQLWSMRMAASHCVQGKRKQPYPPPQAGFVKGEGRLHKVSHLKTIFSSL
jgi:hypothetical protein